MGRQRYIPEFKDEAARQVTEQGHPTTDVTARLGVSIHSLHKSVRDVGPSKDEKRPGELLESKKEILRLQAELRRVEEERDILKKAAVDSIRVKYVFVHAEHDPFSINTMCRILGVARSGFYAWVRRPLSDQSIEGERLVKLIRQACTASDGVYGSPRVFLDLREAGERVGRKRFTRLMREPRIRAIRGDKKPRHLVGVPSVIAPNRLQRQFTFDQRTQLRSPT
jgi:putative transposase